MLFNSPEYIFLFLPLTVFIYFVINSRAQSPHMGKYWLIGASLFFYGWSDPPYVLLFVLFILFNFVVSGMLRTCKQTEIGKRRILLFSGVAVDIIVLAYFKYFGFFIWNVNHLLSTHISVHSATLPLGLSFVTFIQLMYLVDSYRSPSAGYGFLDYGLFSTFFPYILSGPIVHHSEIVPQVATRQKEKANYHNLSLGIYLISIGLFKKVIIADEFSEWATAGFDKPDTLNCLYAWVTSLSYTLQIYFDFSGYTDMAIGTASMFNIRLPINFDSPYKSLNIQDFWRRWHITLGRFLREYVYIPLGGNRVSENRVRLNLMITFIICGIWHGAGWTFVSWGFLHGMALLAHRAWKKAGLKMPVVLAWLLTFNFVNSAWVFFRAKSWNDAMKVLAGMYGLNGITLPDQLSGALGFLHIRAIQFMEWRQIMKGSRDACIWIPVTLAVCLFLKNSNELADNFKAEWKTFFVVGAGVYALLHLFKVNEFLYSNF